MKKVYPIGSMEIGGFVLGLHKLLCPGLAIVIVLSLFGGTPCVGDLSGYGGFHDCVVDLMARWRGDV